MATISIMELTSAEKLQLVEDLWDDIAAEPNEVPVHDWQKEALDRRKTALLSAPESGSAWEGVKQRIRTRYGR